MNIEEHNLNEPQKPQFGIPVVMRSALVAPDNYFGMEEWYIPVVECPKCKHKVPARNTNYYSGCEIKLKLSITVQKYVDNAW